MLISIFQTGFSPSTISQHNINMVGKKWRNQIRVEIYIKNEIKRILKKMDNNKTDALDSEQVFYIVLVPMKKIISTNHE